MKRLSPTVRGPWRRIHEEADAFLNDFCLFRDQEGWWHAIGIRNDGRTGNGWVDEDRFFHAAGRSLDRSFEPQPPLFEGMPRWVGPGRSDNDRPAKHAPFVLRHDGLYHMFYRRPPGTCLVTRTDNAFDWPNEAELVFEEGDARDACILPLEGRFLMYHCQAAKPPGEDGNVDCVMLRESDDLRSWSDGRVVFHSGKPSTHARTESPFVLDRPEGFYLFYRDRTIVNACLTPVFFSTDPRAFPCGPAEPLKVLEDIHAPEIAVDADGQPWIARVSGPRHANPNAPRHGGWVEVAPLDFMPR